MLVDKLFGIRRSVPRLTYYVVHWQLSSIRMVENQLVDQLSQKTTLCRYSTSNLNGMCYICHEYQVLHLSDYQETIQLQSSKKSSFVRDFLNTVQKVHGMQILLNSMSCASRSLPAGYSPGMILMLNDFEQLPRQRSTTS